MNNLAKISFAISIIGIFILLILTNVLKPGLINISDITITDLDKNVKIKGKIKNIRTLNTFSILTLSDSTDKIDLLINEINLNFSKNSEITVIGTVNLYKNNLQIQVKKIY